MSNREFLELTDASSRSKVMIDVDDISKVKSVSSADFTAPSGAFGIVILKDKSVQYTLEDYYQIRGALADLCEIKSVKEVE